MFIAASFTIAKPWNQANYSRTDDQMNKKKYIHTMEYCSVLKKKGILICYDAMNLENIRLGKIRNHKKTIGYDYIYLRYLE